MLINKRAPGWLVDLHEPEPEHAVPFNPRKRCSLHVTAPTSIRGRVIGETQDKSPRPGGGHSCKVCVIQPLVSRGNSNTICLTQRASSTCRMGVFNRHTSSLQVSRTKDTIGDVVNPRLTGISACSLFSLFSQLLLKGFRQGCYIYQPRGQSPTNGIIPRQAFLLVCSAGPIHAFDACYK